MNIKSERGQAEIAIVLILATVAIAAVFGMIAANQPGMRARTDLIGEAAGEAIDRMKPAASPTHFNAGDTADFSNLL